MSSKQDISNTFTRETGEIHLGGIDAIVFTAGVGENQTGMRMDACSGLEYLGVKMDEERNNCRGIEQVLSADDSKVKVVLIPTDEEIVIARDTKALVEQA